MQFVVVLVVLALVVVFVSTPLRRQRTATQMQADRAITAVQRVEELEAAREAKYREIRDAELDHGTGKLSDADFQSVEKTLRSEAIEILKALDRARERLSAETTEQPERPEVDSEPRAEPPAAAGAETSKATESD